jgi:ankyrin repeat protein
VGNSLDVATLLIDRGADIEAKDKNGWKPLHEAVANNSLGVASLLIDHGANTSGIDLSWMK